MLKTSLQALQNAIPGPTSAKWPQGERFAIGMRHGSMTVELYAPVGVDPQSPHTQDELYIIHSGTGTFTAGNESTSFQPGDVFFVSAGQEHRFTNFTPDFSTWVIFYGPPGGESS